MDEVVMTDCDHCGGAQFFRSMGEAFAPVPCPECNVRVYVKTGGGSSKMVYHTNEECPRLRQARNYRPTSLANYDHLRPCPNQKCCDGEVPEPPGVPAGAEI